MPTRFYAHRVNTIEALERVPADLGIELDLRSDGQHVIVTHDPFTSGPDIEEFFPRIGRRPCIFNVKCEGIEARVQSLAMRCGIEDYFFLDLSLPMAVRLAKAGERRVAVRWSEWEPVEAVLPWSGRADWVWVDCFTRYPGTPEQWRELASSFRLCLVSPELQRHDEATAVRLKAFLSGLPYHAVCTKQPDKW